MAELLRRVERPKYGVDIDDTLAKTAEKVTAEINAIWNTSLTADDWDEHLPRLFAKNNIHLTDHQFEGFLQDVFFPLQRAGQLEVVEGSKEAIDELSDEVDFFAVTSRRSDDPKMVAATNEWVKSHYPSMDRGPFFSNIYRAGVALTAYDKTKGPVYEAQGADGAIEDLGKHLKAAVSLGMHAVLLQRHEYSKTEDLPSVVDRANNWQEIPNYIRSRHGLHVPKP